jgi:hypothetical protein
MISGEYEGDLKEGVREGTGKLTWSNGDKYTGEFKNGLRYVSVSFCIELVSCTYSLVAYPLIVRHCIYCGCSVTAKASLLRPMDELMVSITCYSYQPRITPIIIVIVGIVRSHGRGYVGTEYAGG